MTVESMSQQMKASGEPARHPGQGKIPLEIVGPSCISVLRSQTVRSLYERFVRIHWPETLEEMQLVERLAIAQSKLDEAQEAWDERIRWQMERSAELLERGQLERFRADLKAWRNDPYAMRMVFGQTWYSAAFLRDLWFEALSAIESDIALSFHLVKDMIHAQSGDWRVDRIDAGCGRIMSWIVALQPDAANFSKRWVAESRAGREDVAEIELDQECARAILAAAPSPVDAGRALKELVEEETRIWSEQADQLFVDFQAEQARYAKRPPPHPLGTADDVRETRRIRRELNLAETRVEKLELRLQALLKMRRRPERKRFGKSQPVVGTTRPESRESIVTHPEAQTNTNSQSSGNDTLSDCKIETAGDSPPSRNATNAAESSETDLDPTRPDQSKCRPDPGSVAKRWRAKNRNDRSRSRHRSGRCLR